MFLHASKTYSAEVSGQVEKRVTCEKCSTAFSYFMTRSAQAEAMASYGLFSSGARRTAQRCAGRKLEKRLRREVELVPCPACGWTNQAIVIQYRRQQYRAINVLALAVLGIAGAGGLALYAHAQKAFHPVAAANIPSVWLVALSGLALTAMLLIIQRHLRLRIDPNRGYESRAQRGATALPMDPPAGAPERMWAEIKESEPDFEPICCECMAPATCQYRMPVNAVEPVEVPLCRECLHLMRLRWWRRSVLLALVGVAAAFVASGYFVHIHGAQRALIVAILSVPFVAALLIAFDPCGRPYRTRNSSRGPAFSRIQFRNPAYTAILIRRQYDAETI